jgi:hypothetical protein
MTASPAVGYAAASPPDAVAARMLSSTRKRWYNPDTDIDWGQDLLPGLYFMPPEHVSLFGTPLWAQMSEQQRIDLSRHEVSSIAQCGIWLELILNGLLLHEAYKRDPRSSQFQYALTEIADECRHSIMFADLADKLETPRYGPGRFAQLVGMTVPRHIPAAEAYASMLVSEEILDSGQRHLMRDERVQPFVREVCALHVAEESRHIGYARAELAKLAAGMGRMRRDSVLGYLTGTGIFTIRTMINPAVYPAVGLDRGQALRAVRHSKHRRSMYKVWTERFSPYLQEIGLFDGPWGAAWRRAGLTPEAKVVRLPA